MPNVGYDTKTVSLHDYKKNKIKMLKSDFKIALTKEQKAHINELENECAVDRYSRTILRDYLFGGEM